MAPSLYVLAVVPELIFSTTKPIVEWGLCLALLIDLGFPAINPFVLDRSLDRRSMVSSLEDVLNKLTLTGIEEEILIADDIEFDEKGDQIAFCLNGKLLTEKSFNPKAMKIVF